MDPVMLTSRIQGRHLRRLPTRIHLRPRSQAKRDGDSTDNRIPVRAGAEPGDPVRQHPDAAASVLDVQEAGGELAAGGSIRRAHGQLLGTDGPVESHEVANGGHGERRGRHGGQSWMGG